MARVLLGMSGGLDSSVAAVLLKDAGHDVIGMTIKTYKYEDVGTPVSDTSCCSLDGINDARRVARALGIPHYVSDMTEEFGSQIIEYFKETYLAGATPNPCVKCNREIKWAAMLRKADALGCDYIATGHYARLRDENGRMVISRAADAVKDQTYALWAIRDEHLRRTLFPLADLSKDSIRQIARDRGLPVAGKRESYEICFVTDNDYRRFLEETVEDIHLRAPAGEFVLDGVVVGQHRGTPFYTIGQRKGLGLCVPSHPEPLYVTGLDIVENKVILGDNADLDCTELVAESLNLQKYDTVPPDGLEVTAKIRYKDEGARALVVPIGADAVRVAFRSARRAVTPGQSVVFYEGDDLLGGAIITRAITS